jgi:hypothetical protein
MSDTEIKAKKQKKEKKGKKDSSKKIGDDAVTVEDRSTESNYDQKEKKEKKKRKRDTTNDNHEIAEEETPTKAKKATKEERKKLKDQKKAEKEALLAKVPKVDKDGIAYTKVQIKRMLKRVKRGLDPVPSEEEMREIIRARKEEERETEMEMADMLFRKNDMEHNDDGDDVASDQNDDDNVDEDGRSDQYDNEEEDEEKENGIEKESSSQPPVQKKPRSKTVPDDYICAACQNAHSPAHWIYDCPDKIHQPGTNQKKKSQRGVHESSAKKVFVSGLPFDATTKIVADYFENILNCGKVEQCKLLTFEDTKRCKGQGFITFETEIAAAKALKQNGTVLKMNTGSEKGKKTKDAKKELKLGVKKVVNRAVMKSKK